MDLLLSYFYFYFLFFCLLAVDCIMILRECLMMVVLIRASSQQSLYVCFNWGVFLEDILEKYNESNDMQESGVAYDIKFIFICNLTKPLLLLCGTSRANSINFLNGTFDHTKLRYVHIEKDFQRKLSSLAYKTLNLSLFYTHATPLFLFHIVEKNPPHFHTNVLYLKIYYLSKSKK